MVTSHGIPLRALCAVRDTLVLSILLFSLDIAMSLEGEMVGIGGVGWVWDMVMGVVVDLHMVYGCKRFVFIHRLINAHGFI